MHTHILTGVTIVALAASGVGSTYAYAAPTSTNDLCKTAEQKQWQLENAKKKLAETETALQQAKDALTMAQKERAAADKKLVDANQQKSVAGKSIENANEDIEERKGKLEEAKKKLEEAEAAAQAVKDARTQLNAELEKSNKDDLKKLGKALEEAQKAAQEAGSADTFEATKKKAETNLAEDRQLVAEIKAKIVETMAKLPAEGQLLKSQVNKELADGLAEKTTLAAQAAAAKNELEHARMAVGDDDIKKLPELTKKVKELDEQVQAAENKYLALLAVYTGKLEKAFDDDLLATLKKQIADLGQTQLLFESHSMMHQKAMEEADAKLKRAQAAANALKAAEEALKNANKNNNVPQVAEAQTKLEQAQERTRKTGSVEFNKDKVTDVETHLKEAEKALENATAAENEANAAITSATKEIADATKKVTEGEGKVDATQAAVTAAQVVVTATEGIKVCQNVAPEAPKPSPSVPEMPKPGQVFPKTPEIVPGIPKAEQNVPTADSNTQTNKIIDSKPAPTPKSGKDTATLSHTGASTEGSLALALATLLGGIGALGASLRTRRTTK